MFTLEQLVSFGQYLLSDERIARVQEERANEKDEMLDKVHKSDLERWATKHLETIHDTLDLLKEIERL